MKRSLLMLAVLAFLFCHVPLSSGRIPQVEAYPQKQNSSLREAISKVCLKDPGATIVEAIELASQRTKMPLSLVASLMYSESSFKPRAISSKGYKGLMQIPHEIFWEDVNALVGARIYMEKLKRAKGDHRKAIMFYKGWPSSSKEGKRQADKVLRLAQRLEEEGW